MMLAFRDQFILAWQKYFGTAPLPFTFYYTDTPNIEPLAAATGHLCLMALLARVAKGHPLCLDEKAVGCVGGKRYLGFTQHLAPNFEYFLSYGLEGECVGERYKKSPAIVKNLLRNMPEYRAPARYIVFKRWDCLTATDTPQVAFFLATPDVLSGLFTLAGFEESQLESIRAPFGAGCATIVTHPMLEAQKEPSRAVLGMFDVSARPFVPANSLSFALPIKMLKRMLENMPESFLTTDSWHLVQRRLDK